MYPSTPQPRLVEAVLRFYTPDELHATCVFLLETRGVELTVIHENLSDVTASDLVFGGCTEHMEVQDGETITLIARFDGEVIACGVYQVDGGDLAETMGLLLRPCVETHVLLTQEAEAYLGDLPQVSAAEVACEQP